MPILQQQPVQRLIPVFRPADDFRRWYCHGPQNTLAPHESDIINALESVRRCALAARKTTLSNLQAARYPAPRVLVIDPPGQSSIKLLTSYLAYLDAKNPDNDHRTLIVDSGRTSLKEVATYGYPNARLITARQGLRYRGDSYRRLLMLNIDKYRTFSPFRERPVNWSQLYRALVGPVTPDNDSIVILHMTLPKAKCHQRRRLEHLSRILPGVFNIQPEILERTRDLVRRILDHNRLLNNPLAIPLDMPVSSDDDTQALSLPPPSDSTMHNELCIKNC